MLLWFAHLIIAQNELEQNNILNKRSQARVAILKKGLDLSKIMKSSKKQYDAIWIARCEQWKNPEVFLELAAFNPQLRFCMICSKVDSHEEFFLDVQKKALNQKNVTFFDFVKYDEIYILLSKSKVFCITSDYEGDWPMTVLEATATGLPILSYKLNYGELIDSYKAGMYCDGNFFKLVQFLTQIIKNKKVYSKMSYSAFNYFLKVYSIEKNVDLLLYYLMELLYST